MSLPLLHAGITWGAPAAPIVPWAVYYTCNQTSGQTVYDATGHGNTLSFSAPPEWPVGILGNAASPQVNDYLFSLNFPFGTVLSWNGWVRLTSAGQSLTVLGVTGNVITNAFTLTLELGVPTLTVQNTGGTPFVVTAPAALPADTWHMLTAIFDAATGVVSLTVDAGAPVTATFAGTEDTENYVILFYNSTASFDVAFDESGLYLGVLSAGDVSALYNGGAGLPQY